ncbi:MAG: TonB-dependent receptor, partial [Allomuricauda sp.]
MKHLKVPCTLILWFFPLAFFAQEVKKDSVNQLDEIILIEDITERNATGITPYTSIGVQTFEKFNPIDVVSAVNQIPGVYVLSGALNTNRITI